MPAAAAPPGGAATAPPGAAAAASAGMAAYGAAPPRGAPRPTAAPTGAVPKPAGAAPPGAAAPRAATAASGAAAASVVRVTQRMSDMNMQVSFHRVRYRRLLLYGTRSKHLGNAKCSYRIMYRYRYCEMYLPIPYGTYITSYAVESLHGGYIACQTGYRTRRVKCL
jgi:hypothetical protein